MNLNHAVDPTGRSTLTNYGLQVAIASTCTVTVLSFFFLQDADWCRGQVGGRS